MRHLILILGDQLNFSNPALENFDAQRDRILMIEAVSEGTQVWSHQARIVLFLSAMRHFADQIRERSWPLSYIELDAELPNDFAARLQASMAQQRPQALRVTEPGELRMQQLIEQTCTALKVPLRLIDDTHFLCSRVEFSEWANGKKELRMEYFYRVMRAKHQVLMEARDGSSSATALQPIGGEWNYDSENRRSYPKRGHPPGPGPIPAPAGFAPDAITQRVMELVAMHFSGHPGSLENFNWPVTRTQALHALKVFIDTRLPQFGAYQDAMWTDTPFGWHALLSSSLNLHLLDPREVIAAAESAYRNGAVPLASAEGFIRQILGWREFIRGVYWHDMPALKSANHYRHARALPAWYWTGVTRMSCMQACVGQTLDYGYAHHIQRLMVTGNFALLAELTPQQVSDWYRAVYVDAIEWVELPNTIGMTLNACDGRFTSKPYIASGAYIKRQSNYCDRCGYDPAQRTGPRACPFTTLYWNFVDRHETALLENPRTVLMAKNLSRISQPERVAIRSQARAMLEDLDRL